MFDEDYSSFTGSQADLNGDGKVDFIEYDYDCDDFNKICGNNYNTHNSNPYSTYNTPQRNNIEYTNKDISKTIAVFVLAFIGCCMPFIFAVIKKKDDVIPFAFIFSLFLDIILIVGFINEVKHFKKNKEKSKTKSHKSLIIAIIIALLVAILTISIIISKSNNNDRIVDDITRIAKTYGLKDIKVTVGSKWSGYEIYNVTVETSNLDSLSYSKMLSLDRSLNVDKAFISEYISNGNKYQIYDSTNSIYKNGREIYDDYRNSESYKNAIKNDINSSKSSSSSRIVSSHPTTSRRSTIKEDYDPYNANDYKFPEDFYEDHYDDFFDYDDAEDYFNEHNKKGCKKTGLPQIVQTVQKRPYGS